jgi:peptide-methionine (S)-S-oxide reductase
MKSEVAIFGGGCFWCTEAVFKMLTGVTSVSPGYTGGTVENPTYEQVSTGKTGHAEVIKVEYDPKLISFESLLTVFFTTHDPTTVDRQGADVGTQYRSIIFYTTEDQRKTAIDYIRKINESSAKGAPVVTEVTPLSTFFDAEGYHKDYYARNKDAGYCQVVINPKLDKVTKEFSALIKQNQ